MGTIASEPPEFFTVDEAARVLRVGRTAAYALAQRWRTTDGKEGLPVIEFGRLLRVPRVALEEMCGGPITKPVPSSRRGVSAVPAKPEPVAAEVRATPAESPRPRRRRRRSSVSPNQASFPFE